MYAKFSFPSQVCSPSGHLQSLEALYSHCKRVQVVVLQSAKCPLSVTRYDIDLTRYKHCRWPRRSITNTQPVGRNDMSCTHRPTTLVPYRVCGYLAVCNTDEAVGSDARSDLRRQYIFEPKLRVQPICVKRQRPFLQIFAKVLTADRQ